MNETLNQFPDQYIRERLLNARKDGWKVKFEYGSVNNGSEVVDFRANKKHVNLRGHRGERQYLYSDKYTGNYICGWVFTIYVRNKNGGDNRAEEFLPLDEAIAAANKHAAEEEPAIPTWKRGDLPEPFMLPDEDVFECEVQNNPYYTRNNILEVRFERLVHTVRCLGVVSIGGDCTVSVEASMAPNIKAWFLFECYGTRGKFLIISDGDSYYPVKKTSNHHKVSLDMKLSRADLSKLSNIDTKSIRVAAVAAANHYSEQFK